MGHLAEVRMPENCTPDGCPTGLSDTAGGGLTAFSRLIRVFAQPVAVSKHSFWPGVDTSRLDSVVFAADEKKVLRRFDIALLFFQPCTAASFDVPHCRKTVRCCSFALLMVLTTANFGSPTWARTRDLRINSPALYRLSYWGSEERNYSNYFSALQIGIGPSSRPALRRRDNS